MYSYAMADSFGAFKSYVTLFGVGGVSQSVIKYHMGLGKVTLNILSKKQLCFRPFETYFIIIEIHVIQEGKGWTKKVSHII